MAIENIRIIELEKDKFSYNILKKVGFCYEEKQTLGPECDNFLYANCWGWSAAESLKLNLSILDDERFSVGSYVQTTTIFQNRQFCNWSWWETGSEIFKNDSIGAKQTSIDRE